MYAIRSYYDLKKVLTPDDSSTKLITNSANTKSKKYQVATAALLIEIAKSDGNFSDDERKRIIDFMKNDYDLDDECVTELIELSEHKVEESISIYEFSSILNETFNRLEKLELMKNLWRIIYP